MDACRQKAQGQYKVNFDRRVCVASTLCPGDLVFIDRTPLSSTKLGIPNNIATVAYNRLLRQSLVPFCIIAVHSNYLVVDEHGVQATVSIGRPSHAPQIENLNSDGRVAQLSCRGVSKNTRFKNSYISVDTAEQKLIDNQTNREIAGRAKIENCTQKYTVDINVKHIRLGCNIKHITQKYSYSSKEEPMKSPEHVFSTFYPALLIAKSEIDQTKVAHSHLFQIFEELTLTPI